SLDVRVNRFRFFGDSLAYAVGEYVYRFKRNTDIDSVGTIAPLAIESTFPTPSSGAVTIRYHTDVEAVVTAEVIDATGRGVQRLTTAEAVSPGTHELVWDGRNRSGAKAASGLYFIRLTDGENVVKGSIVLVGGGL